MALLTDTNSFEVSQRRSLSRMKYIATGLLAFMTVVFVIARSLEAQYVWLGWVRAFAEAAMVGALADWFAVEALFRRPLGLPIPHTAIIPANKERIGEAMGSFVQSNFLSEEVLGKRLHDVNIAEQVGSWMARAENAKRVSEELASSIPEIMGTFSDAEIQSFVTLTFSELTRDVAVAPAFGHVLSTLIAGNKHQELLGELLGFVEHLLERHQVFIRESLRKELPWYVPDFVHDKVYATMVAHLKNTLAAVNADRTHELRIKFEAALERYIQDLKHSSHYRKKGEELKAWFLSHQTIRHFSERLWEDIKLATLRDLARSESRIRLALERAVTAFSQGLSRDHELQRKINDRFRKTVRSLIRNHREEIAALIADTVKRWDTKTLIEKFELQVGNDLQYIRLNGTFVGGLAGVFLYALSFLIIR